MKYIPVSRIAEPYYSIPESAEASSTKKIIYSGIKNQVPGVKKVNNKKGNGVFGLKTAWPDYADRFCLSLPAV